MKNSHKAWKPTLDLNKPVKSNDDIDISRLRPLRDVVIIQKLPDLNKTPGGIHLIKGDEQPMMYGKVIAKGPGCVDALRNRLNETDVINVGDTVVYSSYANEKIRLGWTDYKAILVKDIMAVIDDYKAE